MSKKKSKELDKRSFLISVSDKLKDREVSHLIFLSRGVILSREATDQVHTFLELVDAMEKKGKIDEAMKDWEVLYDILELIKRKDIVKSIKDFGTKYRRQRMTVQKGISGNLLQNPFQSLDEELNDLEISETTISLKLMLQPGEFSDLWKGTVKPEKDVIIEVYKANGSQPTSVQPAFLQSRLKHENIVEVLKIIRNKEPPWIVLEYLANGDLQTFLRSGNTRRLTNVELIGFATQIAKGMRYLSDNQYAHCSLMASNVFLTERNVVKIGGFSVARKLGEAKVYDLGEDVRLSVRWCAPEVLLYRQVTKKSDVWSFGILLIEMFNEGANPYQGIENSELLPRLRSGYRHPKPVDCPDGLYKVMTLCWNLLDDMRPSFKELITALENHKELNEYSVFPSSSTSPSLDRTSVYSNQPRVHSSLVQSDSQTIGYIRCISEIGHEDGAISLPRVAPTLPPPPAWVKEVEIPRDSITFIEQLGSGEFGEVWRAELSNQQHVAVKKFIPPKMEAGKFLEEAEMMRKFNHPHLISLIGICAKELPILIVTELMALGSLLQFLRHDAGISLLTHTRLHYAVQVADAMAYIEQMKCIHRDIAARNVLMRDRTTVKLSDFGLSRTIESSYYQAMPDVRFPVRWTSPEAAMHRKFSIKSDVWAFGIFLIELMTYGVTPYPEMNNNEVLMNLQKGYKHPQPESCPDDVYEVMISCWRKTENRPSFKDLLNTIKRLRDSHAKEPKYL